MQRDTSTDFKSITENTRKLSLSAPLSTLAPIEPFQMKVMKLPAPFFAIRNPYGDFANQNQFAVSNHLKLSTSLDPVYVGETFRTCVSLSHNFRSPLVSIGVKIEMQKIEGSSVKPKGSLLESSERDWFVFGVGESKDYVISYMLTEPGEHCLACSVMYPEEMQNGQTMRKTFKKTFRFQVHEPFMAKTQVHHRDELSLVEISLTCAIPRPIVVEQVKILGAPDLTFFDLNQTSCSTDDNPENTPGSFLADPLVGVMLKGGDSRSYLFRCDFPPGVDKLLRLSDLSAELAWRSLGGETGFLRFPVDTKKIREQLKAAKEYELILLEAPGTVQLEQPFAIKLQVRSNSMRSFELRLQMLKDKMVTILPCGLSNRSLGTFEPKGTKEVTVKLMPLGLGVHRISGFRLSCPKFSTHMDFDALHEVEVVT